MTLERWAAEVRPFGRRAPRAMANAAAVLSVLDGPDAAGMQAVAAAGSGASSAPQLFLRTLAGTDDVLIAMVSACAPCLGTQHLASRPLWWTAPGRHCGLQQLW